MVMALCLLSLSDGSHHNLHRCPVVPEYSSKIHVDGYCAPLLPDEPDVVKGHPCTMSGLIDPLPEGGLEPRIDHADDIAACHIFAGSGADQPAAGRIYVGDPVLLVYHDPFRQPLNERSVPFFTCSDILDIRYVILDKK